MLPATPFLDDIPASRYEARLHITQDGFDRIEIHGLYQMVFESGVPRLVPIRFLPVSGERDQPQSVQFCRVCQTNLRSSFSNRFNPGFSFCLRFFVW